MPDEAGDIVSAVLSRLSEAWNSSDGAAFAAQFSDGTNVINIVGRHVQGRDLLATHMQQIFDTVYKNSHHSFHEIEVSRFIGPDSILAVSSDDVAITSGPRAPGTKSRQTFLLTREADGWRISHWHNTSIQGTPDR